MKLTSLLFLALALSFGQLAFAQTDTWGLGLRFGSPTAFTAKRYIGTTRALDINVGNGFFATNENSYGPYRDAGFSVMVNYLWRTPIKDAAGLQFYYGLGGMVSSRSYYYDNKNHYRTRGGLGLTGALGLEYFIPKAPIALFVEVNPYIEFFPAPFWINLGAGIGGRYIF